MEDLLDSFIYCPISQQIFLDPVTAEDGHVYERQEILKWFRNKSTSPITNEKIGKNLVPAYSIKNMVEGLITLRVELKSERYAGKIKFDQAIDEVVIAVKNGDEDKLRRCSDYSLDAMISKENLSFMDLLAKNLYKANTIQYIVENSNGVYVKDFHGWQLIHYACKHSNLQLLKYLVNVKKIDVDSLTTDGNFPLNIATVYGSVYLVDYLLKNGAKYNRFYNYYLPIHQAAKKNSFDKIKLFHDFGQELNPITSSEYFYSTYLFHIICGNCDRGAIDYMIERGVDLNIMDTKKINALSFICRNSSEEDINYFVDRYIEKGVKKVKKFCNPEGHNCPLGIIYNRGMINLYKKTVLKNIDIGQSCSSLMYKIIREKNEQLIRWIIDSLTNDYLKNFRCYNGWTFLHCLIRYSDLKMIEHFLQKVTDFDLNSKNDNGETPLHFSVRYSNSDTFLYLLQKGSDPEIASNHGIKCLNLAITEKKYIILDILIEECNDFEYEDGTGLKPVVYFVRCQLSLFKYCVKKCKEKCVDGQNRPLLAEISEFDKLKFLVEEALKSGEPIYLFEKWPTFNGKKWVLTTLLEFWDLIGFNYKNSSIIASYVKEQKVMAKNFGEGRVRQIFIIKKLVYCKKNGLELSVKGPSFLNSLIKRRDLSKEYKDSAWKHVEEIIYEFNNNRLTETEIPNLPFNTNLKKEDVYREYLDYVNNFIDNSLKALEKKS